MFKLPYVALIAVALVAFCRPVYASETKKAPAAPPAKAKAAKAAVKNPLDINGDGKVDASERTADRKKRQEAALAKKHAAEAAAKDKREKAHAEQLKKFDANGNGKIDPQELGAVRRALSGREGQGGGSGAAAKPITNLAKEREELRRKFDVNGDGKFSPEEMVKVKEALRRNRGK